MRKHTRTPRRPASTARASLFALSPLAQSVRTVLIPVGVSLGIISQGVFASPTGEVITQGKGNVTRSSDGKTTTVNQGSQRIDINWKSFNVGADEFVNYDQAHGANATAINRILDQNASRILGQITAPGKVVLINHNGVYFSAGSVVDVGSLLTISHAAKALGCGSAGACNDAGKITSKGTINASAGDVVLIGDWVKNTGKITAEKGVNLYGKRIINEGTVTASTGGIHFSGDQIVNAKGGLLVAKAGEVKMVGGGTQTTLDFEGDGLLRFAVDSRVLDKGKGTEEGAITNRGTIEGKTVVLDAEAARDVFTYAVNNEGVIRATQADNSGGTIRLLGGTTGNVASSGTLDASSTKSGKSGGEIEIGGAKVDISGNVLATGDAAGGIIRAEAVERLTVRDATVSVRSENAKGGEAALLGKEVVLLGKTHIDASGKTGGGIVRIGGGYQGGEKAYRNSLDTYLGENVTADVSARLNGDGGKAIVWSDNMTYYHGLIKADAGKEGGDGGFIEVSGKKSFDIRGGRFSATAPFGKLGTVLLDPDNIYLRAGSAQANESGPRALTSGDPIEITFQSDLAPPPNPKAYIYADQLTNLLNRNAATYILQATTEMKIGDNGTDVTVSSNRGSLLMRAQTVTAESNFTFNATGGSNVSFGIDATNIDLRDISITGGTRLGQISVGGTSGANIGWGDSTNTAFNRGNTTTSITMGKFEATGGTGLTINATGALKIGTDGGSNNGFKYDGSGNVTVEGGTGSAAYLGVVRLDTAVDGKINFDIKGDIKTDAIQARGTGLTIKGNSLNFNVASTNVFSSADLRYTGSGNVKIEATAGSATLGDVLLDGFGLTTIDVGATKTLTMGTFTANSGSNGSKLTSVTDAATGNITETTTTIPALSMKAGTITQTGDLTYSGDGTVKIEATAGNASLENISLTGNNLGAIHLGATETLTTGTFTANSGSDTLRWTSDDFDSGGAKIPGKSDDVTDGAFEMRAKVIDVDGLTYRGKNDVNISATTGNASLGDVNLSNTTELAAITLKADNGALTMGKFAANSGSSLNINADEALKIGTSGTTGDFVYKGTGNVTVAGGADSDVNLGNVAFTQSGLKAISFAVGSGALRMNKFSSTGSGESLKIDAGTGKLIIGALGTTGDFTYEGAGNVTVTGGADSDVNLGNVAFTQSGLKAISFAVDSGALRMNKFSSTGSGERLNINAGTGKLIIGASGTTGDFVYTSTSIAPNDVTVAGGADSDVNLGDVSLTGDNLRDIFFEVDSGALTMDTFTANSGTSLSIEAGSIAKTTTTATGNIEYSGFGSVTINATNGDATLGDVKLSHTTGLTAITLKADNGALTMGKFEAKSGSSLNINADEVLTIGTSGTTGDFTYEGAGNVTVAGGADSDVNLGNVAFTQSGLKAISFAVGSGALRMNKFSSTGSGESLKIDAGTGKLIIGALGTTGDFTYEGAGNVTVAGGADSDVNLGNVAFTQSGLKAISFAVGSGALRMNKFSSTGSGESLKIDAGTGKLIIGALGTTGDFVYKGTGNVTVAGGADSDVNLGNVAFTQSGLKAISFAVGSGALRMNKFSSTGSGESLKIDAGTGKLIIGALGTTGDFTYEGTGNVTVAGGADSDVNLGNVAFTQSGLKAISFAVGSGALRMNKFSSTGSGESLKIDAGTGKLIIGALGTTGDFVYKGTGNVTVAGGADSDVNLGNVAFTQSGLKAISFAVGSGALRMNKFSSTGSGESLKIDAGTGKLIIGALGTTGDFTYEGTGNVTVAGGADSDVNLGNVALGQAGRNLGNIDFTLASGALEMGRFTADSSADSLTMKAGSITQAGALTYGGKGIVNISATTGNATLGDVNLSNTTELAAITLKADNGVLTMGKFEAKSGSSLNINAKNALTVGQGTNKGFTYEGTGNVTVAGGADSDVNLGNVALGQAGRNLGNIDFTLASGALEMGRFTADSSADSLTMKAGSITQAGALTYGGKGIVNISATTGNATLGDVNLSNTTELAAITLKADNGVLTMGKFEAKSGSSLNINAKNALTVGQGTNKGFTYEGTGNVTVAGGADSDVNLGNVALGQAGRNLGNIDFTLASGALEMGRFTADSSADSLTMKAGSITQAGALTYGGKGIVNISATTGNATLGDVNLSNTTELAAITLKADNGVLTMGKFEAKSGSSLNINAKNALTVGQGTNKGFTYEGTGNVTVAGGADSDVNLGNVALGQAGRNLGNIDFTLASGALEMGRFTADSSADSLTMKAGSITQAGALTYGGKGIVNISATTGNATLGDVNLSNTTELAAITLKADNGVLTMGKFEAKSGSSLNINAKNALTVGQGTNKGFTYEGTGNVTVAGGADSDVNLGNVALGQAGRNLGNIDFTLASGALEMGRFTADSSADSLTMKAGSITQAGALTYGGKGIVNISATTGNATLGDVNLSNTTELAAITLKADNGVLTMGKFEAKSGSSLNINAKNALTVGQGTNKGFTYEGTGNVTVAGGADSDVNLGNVALGQAGRNLGNIDFTLASGALEMGRFTADSSADSLTMKAGSITQAGALTYGGKGIVNISATTGNATLGDVNLSNTTELAAITLKADNGVLTMGKFEAKSGSSLNINAKNALTVGQGTNKGFTYEGTGNVTVAGGADSDVNLGNVALGQAGRNLGNIDFTLASGALEMGRFTADSSADSLTITGDAIQVNGALDYQGTGNVNITAETGDVNFRNAAKFSGTNLNISADNNITYVDGLSGKVRNVHLKYDTDGEADGNLGRIDVSDKFDRLDNPNRLITLEANEGEYFSFNNTTEDKSQYSRINVRGHARVNQPTISNGILNLPEFREVTGNLTILPNEGAEFSISGGSVTNVAHLIIGGYLGPIGVNSALDATSGRVNARKITFQDGTFQTSGALTVLAAELVFGASGGDGVTLSYGNSNTDSITLAATGQIGEPGNWTLIDVEDGGGDFGINSRLMINSTGGTSSDGAISVSGMFKDASGNALTTFSPRGQDPLLSVNLDGGALYFSVPTSSSLTKDSSGNINIPSARDNSFVSGNPADNANFNKIFLANIVQTLSVREAELSGLQTLSGLEVTKIVDSGVFAPDLTLYDITGKGIALALSQCEEVEGCAVSVSEEELLQLMRDAYRKITRVEYELASTADFLKKEQLISESDSLRADLHEFQRFSKSFEKDNKDNMEQFFAALPAAERAAVALGSLRQRLKWISRIDRLPESGREKLGSDTGVSVSEDDVAGMRDAVERQIGAYQDEIKRFWENQVKQQGNNEPPVFSARVDAPVPQEVTLSQSPLFVIPGGATDNTFRAY